MDEHNGTVNGVEIKLEEETIDARASHNDDVGASHPLSGDGASPGKIFIGGLARETTSAQFVKHFGTYGEIIDSVIMKDRRTGHPRGFGFVTYADPSVVDRVIEEDHIINGKQVEIKRTIPRGGGGGGGGGGSNSRDFKTKKVFIGGIPTTISEDEFRDFFSTFGEVKEHQIMRDHSTGRSRGFGFITFETEKSVEDLLAHGNRLDFAGTQVEIKKAEPKRANAPLPPPSKRQSHPRGGAFGGGFSDAYGGGYGDSGFGSGPYRSGGAPYGGRSSAFGGYGGAGMGGYGAAYGGSGAYGGGFREESSFGYSSRYGGGGGAFGRGGYDFGGGYGGPGEGYGGYGAGAGAGGYGGGYGAGLGSGYGGDSTGGSMYGSRGSYGGAGAGAGAGSGRYHPYGR